MIAACFAAACEENDGDATIDEAYREALEKADEAGTKVEEAVQRIDEALEEADDK